MWVRFKQDFDWDPPLLRGVTIAYRGGRSYSVKQDCGKAAIKARKAVRVAVPARAAAAVEGAAGG